MEKSIYNWCGTGKYFPHKRLSLLKKIMKFSFLIFWGIIITAQWLGASPLNGQNLESVKISLTLDNENLVHAFKKIEKAAPFRFMYRKEDIRHVRTVSYKGVAVSVDRLLESILTPNGLVFKQVGQRIMIMPAPADFRIPAVTIPEEKVEAARLKGKVTDPSGGILPGVSIVVKGTQQGTVSDNKGEFSLDVPNENAVLVFSFVGYISQEVAVDNKTVLNVQLKEDEKSLEEIVVIGYGTTKKVNLTGSVDVISGERLTNRPANNVADLIKGSSPNLNITMGFRGGEPGAGASWNIRGAGSIVGGGAPLILVDGVEMNINNVDPESVESVSILKDASASAVYGSRAPFGVILITTKKGTKGDKVNIQYSNNMALASPIRVPSQVNSLTWATAFNQANANAGLAPVYGDAQMQRIKGYLDGTFKDEYDPTNPPNTIWAGRQMGNANNNWPQLLMKDFSFNQKHNINVSGGNDKTQYYVSGGFVQQDGVYSYGYDDYKRYNFMTNFTSQITKWLKFNSSVKYAAAKTDYPVGQTTVTRDNFFVAALQFAPVMPLYNVNGTIQHPIVRWAQGTGRDKSQTSDFFLTLGSEIEPVKGWKTTFSYNFNQIGIHGSSNPKPVMVEVGTGGFGNIGKPTSGYTANFSRTGYELINGTTSYELQHNGHYFKPMIGYEQEVGQYTELNATGVNLITEEVPSLSTSLGEKAVDDKINQWATQGYFGRINYNYKEKYLAEFSARYNGSSRFPKATRWGFFPSASVGYNISRESFWTPVEHYVNSLKLRGSYGSLGNQNIKNYLHLSTIPILNETPWIIDGQRLPYAAVPDLISNNLTWETITTLNIGADASFLKNRLTLTFDWFDRKTTDMLGPAVVLPYLLGTATPKANNAQMRTKGFELVVGWEDRTSSGLSYDVKLGLGDSKSTILSYKTVTQKVDDWYAGKSVGEIWGLETDGLIQTSGEAMPDQSRYYATWGPGDVKYKDLDGDGKVTDSERTLTNKGDLKVIGNISPRYNIGLSGSLRWKGFDMNLFLQGVGRRDYYADNSSMLFWGLYTSWGNSALFENSPALDYWRPSNETGSLGPNTDAYFPKPYFSAETIKNRQVQSKYVLNAAYLRLKNIQVGYNLPGKILAPMRIQNARIYFSGENLLTFSKIPKIFDPETAVASNAGNGGYYGSGVIYPIFRSLSLGLNLTF